MVRKSFVGGIMFSLIVLLGACHQGGTKATDEAEKKAALLSGNSTEKSYCTLADDAAAGRTSNLPKHMAQITREECLEVVLGGITSRDYAHEYWRAEVLKSIEQFCQSQSTQLWFKWKSEVISGKVSCSALAKLFNWQ